MSTSNLNTNAFKSQMQQTEKIHYKGELRIIGQVVNSLSDKEPIGYVVMTEKTQKFKMYTVAQTMVLLQRFKFVNAAIENGKIVNTECAMNRMPKFNTNMQVVGNHGIIILGEIIDNGRKAGYRAMDTNARIVDIEETEIVRLSSNGVDIINAKIVRRDNRNTISAIKSEFTKIEKSKLNEMLNNKKLTRQQQWRNEKHIQKILNICVPNIMTKVFTENSIDRINFSDHWAWRESEDFLYGRVYNPSAEYRIFCKEVLNIKYNCQVTDEDKEILKRVNNIHHDDKVNYCRERLSENIKYFMIAFLQFALNNKNVFDRTVYLIRKRRYSLDTNYEIAKRLVSDKLACDAFKKLINTVKAIEHDAKNERDASGRKIIHTDKAKMFNTTKFVTAKDIAQLGFTVSAERKNMRYKTDYGYTKTLLYLGDIIGSGYDKYVEKSRCLGDLASIAYIEKLIHKINDGVGYGCYTNEQLADVISIIITIAYMFNSTAMKEYVEDARGMLEYEGVDIPDYDEIAGVDYKLSDEITIYYTSGFNVFLSDNDAKHYKHTHLTEAKYINYRQLGIANNIEHDLLQNELASVVSLVTPDTVSGETVTNNIGRLRFL